jgi:hypothetical protein
MPVSPSRKRAPSPPPKTRRIWPIVLLALVAIGALVLWMLPASLITRFLPAEIQAEDFSGSIWHGSSGRISVASRPVGALEWHLHPLSLLSMGVAANVHWVKGASVIDGDVNVNRHGFTAHDVRGGGPLEDLRDFGIAPGWSGNTKFDLQQLQGTFQSLESATGSIEVSALASTAIAKGADLGGYLVTLLPNAGNPDSLTATVKDTGGPLDTQAEIRYTPSSHSALLSGTVKERPEASAALREELSNLAQMKPRDNLGRIPLDLEFAM